MAESSNYTWAWIIGLVVCLVVGGVAGANIWPTTETIYEEVPFEVEVPVETIVEVPVEVEKIVEIEVPATGLDALDDLVESAKAYFEDHIYKVDEWNATEYDLDEIDIEDYDDVSLEIEDWDDNEYTVSFYVDIEYDDGDETVEGTWFVEVSYDEDGEVDLDCTAQ